MKLLVFEPFCGASGDMIIGSLLHLGVREEKVADAVSVFDLELIVKEVKKQGIMAKKVEFIAKKETEGEKERKKGMSYRDIVKRMENSGLNEKIIDNSLRIFEIIGEAEEKVHGKAKEELCFHDSGLGARDTIGDLVGSSVAFMDIQSRGNVEVISTPISVGGGFVEMGDEHGLLPVPAPATVEILKHASASTSLLYRGGPIAEELLTPTGAAILAHFVNRSEHFFPMVQIEKIGYGAGTKDFSLPNVLRVVQGERKIEKEIENEGEGLLTHDRVEILETNVDNVSGEVLGNLIQVLMEAGAKDVAIVPAMMKKGRMGHIIKVIVAPQDVATMAYRIMRETGTLGVRVMPIKHRFVATREKKRVRVGIKGEEREVEVKIGKNGRGDVLNVAAEFEDANKVATALKVPVKEVMKIAEGVAIEKYGGNIKH